MKKLIKYIIPVMAVLLVAIFILPVPAKSDMGNFAGDSDYGGFGGGGGSFGGSNYGDSGGDWGWNSYGSSGYDGSIDENLIVLSVFLVFLVIAIIRLLRYRNRPHTNVPPTITRNMYIPMYQYNLKDSNFDETDMKEKISNMYVRMQKAWTDNTFETIRPFLTDGLYNQLYLQLQEIKNRGQTNYVDRVAVLYVGLLGWYQEGQDDKIVARINTRIVDYTKDDYTGEVVSGNERRELFMEYEWTFQRPTAMRTSDKGKLSEIRCPHCGAPIEINQSAKCPYCETVIHSGMHGWAISEIKGISQRTAE